MPSTLDELIKRRVIQQWFNGIPRDKIAADNNIGAGTVSGIINNYKTQLEDSDFNSMPSQPSLPTLSLGYKDGEATKLHIRLTLNWSVSKMAMCLGRIRQYADITIA
jgi:hypothetical protein